MEKYTTICNNIKKYEEAKNAKRDLPQNPYRYLLSDFIVTLTKKLSEFELVYTNKNKVSMKLTMQNTTDAQLKAAFEIAYYAPRLAILGVKATKDRPEYASLTPLFMYAHKKYHGVPYEDWDKEDSMMRYALGRFLEKLVTEETPPLGDLDIATLRKEALGDKSVLTYRFKMLILDDYKLYGVKEHMILQTWLANVALRYPGAMILDPWNWDNVPEPHDETPKKEVKEKKNAWESIPWD